MVGAALPKPPAGWPQRPPGISLCMIVRDEERFLGDALESVKGVADEICIVDTGSRDRTIAIAREAGAKVRETVWEDDFSRARNAALEMATKRWILVLDADEMLAPRSREKLASLRDAPAYLTGLWIRCYNLTDDYGGGTMSNAIVRVFPNHERLRFRNAIHEFVALDGNDAGMPALASDIAIVHRGYLGDVMRERKKGERNLSLAEAALREDEGSPFNWYNYGTSAFLAGKLDAAVSSLERMRELCAGQPFGFVPSALTLLASLYLNERQDPIRAEEVARDAVARVPSFSNAHFVLGKTLASQRRFGEARDAFLAAIEAGKHAGEHFFVDNEIQLWKAHNEIGGTLVEEGGYELALAWFEFGLKNRPKAQALRLNRARALEGLGRAGEAAEELRRVWEDDRGEVPATEYLNFLLRVGRDPEALAFVEEAAPGLGPENQLIFYGSAVAIASRAGLPGRETYLRRALAVADLDYHAQRLSGLFKHFGDKSLLDLLIEETNAQEPATTDTPMMGAPAP